MIQGYLHEVRQRFTEFGGFAELEPDRAPGPVAMWADSLLLREEEGLTTVVALVSTVTEGALRAVSDGLAAMGREQSRAKTEVLGLLLIVLDRPLTRADYERWQSLKLHLGAVRVLPWVVDLTRGRLFAHTGPPFGTDPDLVVLASPQPLVLEEHPAANRAAAAEPRPLATIGLVGVLVLVWVAMSAAGGSLYATETDDALLRTWGAVFRPSLWREHEYWRLFTATFLHIGWFHLALNSLSLWVVGRAVEVLYSPWRMLYIFLVAGVAGSALSALVGPPLVIAAGASGAIFGLLGAVLWYRLASPLGDRIPWRPLLFTLVLNLGLGLALYHVVDNWNHIGGLLGGMLSAVVVGPPRVAGWPLPRLWLPKPVRAVAAAVLLLGAGALTAGYMDLPGPGRDLARAEAALNEGRYADAEPGFRQAVRRQPDEPWLRFGLAVAYARQGKCGPAAAELKALGELKPDFRLDRDAREALAPCLENRR